MLATYDPLRHGTRREGSEGIGIGVATVGDMKRAVESLTRAR